MKAVDVHQHLWPEAVLAVLERRQAGPKERVGTYEVDADGALLRHSRAADVPLEAAA